MFSTAIYTKGTSTNRGIVSCACADDFVVLCRSEDEAKEALAAVNRLLADRLGLTLSAEKTKVTRFPALSGALFPEHGKLFRHALVALRRHVPQSRPLDTHETAVHAVTPETGQTEIAHG